MERQKLLESRGWTIHRIWSTDWWTDSKQEIAKIVRLIKSIDAESSVVVEQESVAA